MSTLVTFIAGANTLGYLVAVLLFLRARRRTGDALFLAFGIAFAFLAFDQLVGKLAGTPGQVQAWVFLPRLAAFLLLIAAIVRKNIRNRADRS